MSRPSMADVMSAAAASERESIRTCFVAEIIALRPDDKHQYVDVKPSVKVAYEDVDGAYTEEEMPLIQSVPVGYMQGGGFFISVPLAVGDFVTVWCSERSLDAWTQQAQKGQGRAISPGDVGTHVLEGAIAIPCGPAPKGELLQAVSSANLVIGHDSGAQIHVKPNGTIALGSAAPADAVALDSLVNAKFSAVIAAVHTALSAITPVGGGPAVMTAWNTVINLVEPAPGAIPTSVASAVVLSD